MKRLHRRKVRCNRFNRFGYNLHTSIFTLMQYLTELCCEVIDGILSKFLKRGGKGLKFNNSTLIRYPSVQVCILYAAQTGFRKQALHLNILDVCAWC